MLSESRMAQMGLRAGTRPAPTMVFQMESPKYLFKLQTDCATKEVLFYDAHIN